MPAETKTRVAVYGTLRKSCHNHYLLADQKFVGNLELRSPLAMYTQGSLPYAILKEGEIHTMHLEVYDVSNRVLTSLDSLEGHPDWYKRVQIPTSKGDLWIYVLPLSRADISHLKYVKSGNWLRPGGAV